MKGLEQLGRQRVSPERVVVYLGVKPSASVSGPPATNTHTAASSTTHPEPPQTPPDDEQISLQLRVALHLSLPPSLPLFSLPPLPMACPPHLSHSYVLTLVTAITAGVLLWFLWFHVSSACNLAPKHGNHQFRESQFKTAVPVTAGAVPGPAFGGR